MKARVYKNLNKGGLWAIRQKFDGKLQVVGYAHTVLLADVSPIVSDKRHNAVRAKRQREVFAMLEGDLIGVEGFESFKGRKLVTESPRRLRRAESRGITFHPFEEQKRGFHIRDNGTDYRGSEFALFHNDGTVTVS